MDFNEFATDTSSEENGKWFNLSETARIKLRSFQSEKSQKVREQLEEPYLALKRSGKGIPQGDQEKLLIKQMAYAIVVDWEGMKDSGKEAPFSASKAEEMLTKHREFRNLIARLVTDDDAFKASLKEESEKN